MPRRCQIIFNIIYLKLIMCINIYVSNENYLKCTAESHTCDGKTFSTPLPDLRSAFEKIEEVGDSIDEAKIILLDAFTFYSIQENPMQTDKIHFENLASRTFFLIVQGIDKNCTLFIKRKLPGIQILKKMLFSSLNIIIDLNETSKTGNYII
jgi:hypothetical protein